MPPTPTDYPHTPEPWSYAYGAAYQGTEDDVVVTQQANDGRPPVRLLLADRNEDRTRPVERDANVRRAVACVNACAGMADPGAEIKALRTALRNLADRVDNMERPDGSSPPTWEAHAALGDFTPTTED